MLQSIRDRVTGWVAGVIFTLLIIPFALWGVSSYFEAGGEVIAIEVNGEALSLGDYQRAYQVLKQRWQEIASQPITDDIQPLLKQQTIDRLIRAELFKQQSARMRLAVSDADVLNTLEQIPAFNDENGFSPALLEAYVSSQGLTPATFKAQIKQDMLLEQLQGTLIESSFATRQEALRFARIENEKRDLAYVVLSSDKAKERIAVSDAEIDTYYKENQQAFMQPEKVKLHYLVLSAARLADDIELAEGELEAWYQDNRQDYDVAGQRHIRQVLVKMPEPPTADVIAATQQQADSLYALITSGKTLEAVVTEDASEDNRVEYSEFEFLTEGVLEPEVDAVLADMQAGQISEPVKSKYGWHIIELVKVKGGSRASLDEIREQVVADLKLHKAETLLYEQSDQLATLAYEHSDTLDIAAEELGLAIMESDYISREAPGTGVVSDPRVIRAAFSEEVLQQGENSELLELADERLMVLRVVDHIEAEARPLADVREQIITRITFEQAREQTEEQGQAIIAKLHDGVSQEAIASAYAVSWQQASDVSRDDPGINRAVLRQAFNAGRPAAAVPLVSGTSLGSGDYIVVVVEKVHEMAAEDIKQAQVNTLREQLVRTAGGNDWQEFARTLQDHAKVTVYEEVL